MNVNNFLGVKKDSGPFSPIDLSPNLWLDATDATTITEVSGDVSQWDDKSGNSNDVTEATNRPSNGGAINGNNAIDWGSVANSNQLGLVRGANTDNWQDVYVVGRWDGNTTFNSYNGLFSSAIHTYNGLGVSGRYNSNYFLSVSSNWYDNLYVNTLTISSNQQVIGGSNSISDDFILSFSANTPIGVNGVRIGSDRNFSGRGWVGVIGEVVSFDNKLSTTDKEKMEGYLAHKWGLTANLPALHTYKTVAP